MDTDVDEQGPERDTNSIQESSLSGRQCKWDTIKCGQ